MLSKSTKSLGQLLAAIVATFAIIVAAMVTLTGPATAGANVSADNSHSHMMHKKKANKAKKGKISKQALRVKMRELWDEHMEWTYAAVAAFAADSAGLNDTIARLLKNQEDIGNAIKPFYGEAAGNQLTALLKEHIQDAVPVLVAAKAGNTNDLNAAIATWYSNAEQIGNFLADANRKLPRKAAVSMMRMHITQTVSYAADLLAGNYAKSIATYGEALAHMRMMSDELTNALIKQFPKKFKK